MNRFLNRTKLALAVLMIAAASVGAAFAGEGNGEPFPNYAAGGTVVANQVLSDTGSQATPSYGPGVTVLTQGNVLPTDGSNGIVQTANSLPRGFENGTVAYAQAQSVQRWALAHQATSATRLAAVSTGLSNRP
jgi:hypothetical protein